MKRYGFFVLFVLGCASTHGLTNAQYSAEQIRALAYYDGKANHEPFAASFYEHTDSVFTDSTNRKDWNIRINIDAQRKYDSLNAKPATYWLYIGQILNQQFIIK